MTCKKLELPSKRFGTHTPTGIALGRDLACAPAVKSYAASRQHARIERRRDKFFLIDQSTNSTFVSFVGKPKIMLHREEVVLRASDRIALTHSEDELTDKVTAFSVCC